MRCEKLSLGVGRVAQAAIAWFERPVNEALAPNYHAIIKQVRRQAGRGGS